MKTLNLLLVFMVLGITALVAQDIKKEEFKVYGNCGMCEKRIEKAATELDGIVSADWDKESKMILVSFDADKVSLEDIHKAIAKVGHDTDDEKADDEVYNGLPGCCQYERPEEE
ncbi:MAG: heavy-metal-associated domain-containing protein [Bacteroidota bacterium]